MTEAYFVRSILLLTRWDRNVKIFHDNFLRWQIRVISLLGRIKKKIALPRLVVILQVDVWKSYKNKKKSFSFRFRK